MGGNGQPPSQQKVDQAYDKYGMHHGEHAQTYQQMQDQLRIVNKLRHANPLIPPGPELSAQDMLDAQAKQLAKEQGLKRSAPGAPAINYRGLSHRELYDAVHQAQPSDVQAISESWTDCGNELVEVQDKLASSIASSESGWSGPSAEKARHAVAGIGNHAVEAGQGAQLAGTLMERQAQALTTARSMPKPPEHPFDPHEAAVRLQSIQDPAAREVQRKKDQQQQDAEKKAHDEAARVVETYDKTSTHISKLQPAFAPAPSEAKGGGGGGVTGGGGGSVGGGGGGSVMPGVSGGGGSWPGSHGGGYGGGGGGSTGPNGPGSGGYGGGTGGAGGGGVGEPPVVMPSHTSTSSAGGFPGPGTGGPAGPGGLNGLPGGGGEYGGRGPGGPGWNSGGYTGMGAGPRGISGAFDEGVGGGRMGAGRAGASAAGAGSRSAASEAAGGRAGAGMGAAEERAMGRGGAGGRGGVGGRGMMGGGRGAGRGGEDDEHKTPSYLQEPDPDEIFGTDEKTAPPVIGDWSARG